MAKKLNGYNLQYASKLRNKQMTFLMENMTEPCFVPDSDKELDSVFNVKDEEHFNKTAITFRLLNVNGFGGGGNHENTEPTNMSVAVFMNNIQDYLPKSLKWKGNRTKPLWYRSSFANNDVQKFSEETLNNLELMKMWLVSMRSKIEDKLTEHYFWQGKMNKLEILKRRFRHDWSEAKFVDMNAETSIKTNEDDSIKIVIEDA